MRVRWVLGGWGEGVRSWRCYEDRCYEDKQGQEDSLWWSQQCSKLELALDMIRSNTALDISVHRNSVMVPARWMFEVSKQQGQCCKDKCLFFVEKVCRRLHALFVKDDGAGDISAMKCEMMNVNDQLFGELTNYKLSNYCTHHLHCQQSMQMQSNYKLAD